MKRVQRMKSTSNRRFSRLVLAGLVAGGVILSGSGIAQASTTEGKAVEGESSQLSTSVETTAFPATNTVVSESGSTAATITLPGDFTSDKQVDPSGVPGGKFQGQGEPLLSTALPGAVISTYGTSQGTQTLISIESDQAAKEYRFPISLPEGGAATVEPSGSVSIHDAAGTFVHGFKAPWAYDADGTPVPTKFAIDGSTLVQTVAFTDASAFPVTADPNDFWGYTKCVGAIGAFIAGNMFLISKVTKLGGVAKVAVRLLEAKNATDRWQALVYFFGDITGIGAIGAACA